MTCYHIWQFTESGNRIDRVRRCFRTREMANKVARRGVTGDRGGQVIDRTKPFMVLKCRRDCPCGPGRYECKPKPTDPNRDQWGRFTSQMGKPA